VIVWVVGSVLGGKGDFGRFASVIAFPLATAIALMWIPLLNILVGLYSIYLLYIFLQPTMQMDSNKAAITVIAIIVLYLLVMWIFGGAWWWIRY
jgi:hypothetical protein